MDKIIDRINKMLALAESTSNPAEAEAFSAKAEKLMIEYSIEQAHLAAAKGEATKAEEIITETRVYEGKSYAKAQMELGYYVAKAMRLQAHYWTPGNSKHYRLTVVGYASDVQMTLSLIDSLQLQAAVAMRLWWADNKAQYAFLTATGQLIERRTFIRGFASTASDRVRETYSTTVAEATASNSSTELVLLDRSKQVQAFYAKQYGGTLGKGRGNASGSYGSRAAGNDAGKRANIGSRSSGITGGSRSISR